MVHSFLSRCAVILAFFSVFACSSPVPRTVEDFTGQWKFHLGDTSGAQSELFADNGWRVLTLPHDWSIEGTFDEKHPATAGGGALPGGVGWYRKSFVLTTADSEKKIFLEFDGVYRHSEVWINGHSLGKRPNGYISFQYDLTPHLYFDGRLNVVAVRVDDSRQPGSRWYAGAGIYRDVRLVKTGKVYIPYNGVFIRTPAVDSIRATVQTTVQIQNDEDTDRDVTVETILYTPTGEEAGRTETIQTIKAGAAASLDQWLDVVRPVCWSLESPGLYKAVTAVTVEGNVADVTETTFGIRSFYFDSAKGFFLNGKSVKIKGVCLHHDLGCLGAAFNTRAAERQLEIMRGMGVNAIRTSHNPPAPQLLDLCDRMGFLVMDEMFDMWKKKKSEYDYSLDWDAWHRRDLEDFIRRDRNHPSVMIWSIGNEIGEQWDSTGVRIARELAGIVRALDTTRPITTANNDIKPTNALIRSGALDLIGYNYNHTAFERFPADYPGQRFIATETTSALATRGHYDDRSDSIRRWPISWDKLFTLGNPDNTVSAYDHVSAPWGSTHEETWKVMKKHDFLSGMFIWTGFDYLGEPTPYTWPSRSSYFGVVDLAGFPKDVYYMYQSEWTDKPMLHVFPHWNWPAGKVVDVWAYYNAADEAELFLNGVSQGIRRKEGDALHVVWQVPFAPGVVKVVTRKHGTEVMQQEVRTAGAPAQLQLTADRTTIHGDGRDLSFITVRVLDAHGTVVPQANNLIHLEVTGAGTLVGVDNGDPVSHESFQTNEPRAFHGLALLVVKSTSQKGTLNIHASAPGLPAATLAVQVK